MPISKGCRVSPCHPPDRGNRPLAPGQHPPDAMALPSHQHLRINAGICGTATATTTDGSALIATSCISPCLQLLILRLEGLGGLLRLLLKPARLPHGQCLLPLKVDPARFCHGPL